MCFCRSGAVVLVGLGLGFVSRRRRHVHGIRSSPVRLRPVGALLRRRRRACGGRSPLLGDLYRSRSVAAAAVDLVLSRCGGGCGCCGCQEDGSSSSVPGRRPSSSASLDPWPRVLGVCPRPMDEQCWLQLVPAGGCFLWFAKDCVRWSSFRPRGRRRRTAVAVGIYSSAWKGSRDLFVISILLVALSVSRME